MEIWEILRIEKTSDKRSIRAAYAERSKECHPEDKPEEFRQLYEAYQAALRYADLIKRQDKSQDVNGRRMEIESGPARSAQAGEKVVLTALFEKARRDRQEQKEYCLGTWQKLMDERCGDIDYWRSFLNSEAFRLMRHDPEVLNCIVRELNGRDDIPDSVLKKMWDLYEFQGGQEEQYKGDLRILYQCLHAAQRRRENVKKIGKVDVPETDAQRSERISRLMVSFLCVLLLIIAVMKVSYDNTEEKWRNDVRIMTVEKYLHNSFPGVDFKYRSNTLHTTGNQKSWTFSYWSEEPFETDLYVFLKEEPGSDEYKISTDYGRKQFELYAKEYGLSLYWNWERTVFYYDNQDDIESFCDRLMEFVSDERVKDLFYLVPEAKICWSSALFPEAMMDGGDGGLPVRRSYTLDRLPEKETLSREVTESYIDYLYNYEAWNITAETEVKFGSDYIKRAARKKVGKEIEPGILTFQKQGQDTEYITIGNLYRYLAREGADVDLNPNKDSFSVSIDGKTYSYRLDDKKDPYYPIEEVEQLLEKNRDAGKNK